MLELLLTDLHSYYHSPTTLPPLQVDQGIAGIDSDHDIVLYAPKENSKISVKMSIKLY